MASEVSGKILKYVLGIILAILLTHVCVVEIINFSGTSMGLQFSFTAWSAHHIRRRSTDNNACGNSSLVCGQNSNCSIYNGNYSCSCLEGYHFTNTNETNSSSLCIDINECQLYPFVCGPNTNCTNEMGSYNCSCLDGFTATNSSLPISINNTCTVTTVSSTKPPTTTPQITRNTTTTDITGCINSSLVCGPNANCFNYSCSCWEGYNVTKMNETINISNPCIDINECQFKSSVCGPNANCTNLIGSYNCSCLDGFTATNSSLLISINNICRAVSASTLPPTTPLTTRNYTTTDITKCSNSSLVCGPNAYCSNYNGSYSCSCWEGYNISRMNETIDKNNPCIVPPSATTTPSTPSTTRNTTATVTTAPPVTTPSTPSTTRTTTTTTVIGMSMKIVRTYDTSLADPNNNNYKDLSGRIRSTINASYSSQLIGYMFGSTKVSGFRPGSVIADYTLSATSNSLDFEAANTQVSASLRAQGIVLAQDAFAQSDQKNFTTDQLYPLQKVDLNCIQPDFAIGQIKWTVDNEDPALDNTRYLLSNNNRTLTVKSASESDSGRYSCIIQRNTIPYIQWQNIVIKQRPSIIVGDKYRVFPCDGSSFQLKCSVDAGYNIEWLVGGKVLISGSDSITLNYATQKDNCTEKTFTCRLKDLLQLQNYSYSYSSVTVRTSAGIFDCRNEELGVGQKEEERTGVCGTGMKGTITYKCESNVWKSVENNCVLEVFVNFKNQLESLTVEGIAGFMADLSFATSENNINITQSAATVKVIVDILFKIADLSQATVINSPVMGNFLKTVDIIVTGNVSDTWSKLNNGNNTENTSIKLLSAIENISDRLTDEFDIYEKSIQLNRTTIKNSFNITSALPNSTTEIVIPQVPQATIITVVIFTTLDNVLPSEGTNDSRKSDVHINGDVVVVKVNETLNNISFAFDITDQSLGNPQCVFWNFSLNTWDSTGCEVKQNSTGKITCECNHTTSFSILMSPFFIDNQALAFITYIGVAISMASLIICLIIETIVWKSVRRNDTSYMRHVSIVNIAVSLLIANICFIIGAAITEQEQPTSVGRCSPAVFFMHFFYLALFFWMLLSALLLFYRTVMVLSQMSRAKMMVIAFTVGYGAPLLIAVITVASTAGPQNYISKTNACWLNWNESKALLAFVILALTIVAINLVVLIVVLYKMLRRGVGAATQPEEIHTLVVIARCVAFLTPIFGLTWGFGIGTMVSQELGVHVVFALLNSLQGFFILVFGTLLDSKVRESLPGKQLLQKLTSSRTNRTSVGTSSTSGLTVFQRMQRRNVYNVSEANNTAVTDNSNGSYSIMNT